MIRIVSAESHGSATTLFSITLLITQRAAGEKKSDYQLFLPSFWEHSGAEIDTETSKKHWKYTKNALKTRILRQISPAGLLRSVNNKGGV